ncbi:MAG: TraR/DksA C4-type zinc finger protein [Pseudomonadales bacterium]|nr:TraR/DksA C4-type zinc finger protein [Pseudomonadales bacterium]
MNSQKELRTQLIERRAELEKRLEAIKMDLGKPLDHDFAEQAVELENGEVLDVLGAEAESEIQQINHALIRMDEGLFGECQACGEPIAEARLKVRPFTSFCVKCAETQE